MTYEAKREPIAGLMVCVDCIMVIANDEMPVDATPERIAEIERGLALKDGGFWVCDSSEETDDEFSWHACDCCDSSLGGSRHGAAIIYPATSYPRDCDNTNN